MRNVLIAISVFLIVFPSCHSTKNTAQNNISRIGYKKLNTLIKNNNFKFEYYSSKARVNYNAFNFTANIRMKKGETIWISFTGPFNIEGARVLISPSSFQMVDKINRVYYDMPIEFVENYIPVSVDFKLIEQLILGNFLEKNIKRQKIETNDNFFFVKGDTPGLETFYSIHKNGKLKDAKIINKQHNQQVEILYEKYEKIDNQDFPLKRKFLIQDAEKDYLLDLKFYKYKKEKLEFPFKVPKGYTKFVP